MANPEDLAASAAASEPAATAAAPSDAASAAESAKIESPAEPQPAAAEEPAKISYLQPFTIAAAEQDTAGEAPKSGPSRYAPLAAAIALAAALGALAGAAATTAFTSDTAPPATMAVANANRALQDSLTRLEGELATLRAGIATAQRGTGAQIGKLAERIDRSEKAQAEPAAKLAKVIESLDRLEHRLPQPQAAAQPAQPDITGSVAAKPEAKLQLAEGWRLLDLYGGRAVVENRNGRAFEVMPGSNLPGLGRVETIKRENGRVVVVTRNGIIAASTEPRRRPGIYFRD